MRPSIWHFTAALPPAVNGVGDFAAILADALRARGAKSGFITQWAGSHEFRGSPVRRLARRSADGLQHTLEASGARTILLHFSGYGYARWGLCWWLAEGLCRWRRRGSERRLITVFHELYATGPFWRTSFWTALPQRRIGRSLASISDAAMTTSPAGAEKLKSWHPELPIVVSPVFSNVGEVEAPVPFSDRGPFAVVFGQEAQRQRLYSALTGAPPAIGEGLRRFGVARVLDIGPAAAVPASVAGLPVERLGLLDAQAVSARLSEARVGLVDYPLHVVTKSGIMAAFFAHGLLTVNTSTVGTLPDGIEEGRHFAHPHRLSEPTFDAEAVAAEGFAWYRPHSRDATAEIVERFIS